MSEIEKILKKALPRLPELILLSQVTPRRKKRSENKIWLLSYTIIMTKKAII